MGYLFHSALIKKPQGNVPVVQTRGTITWYGLRSNLLAEGLHGETDCIIKKQPAISILSLLIHPPAVENYYLPASFAD
jgi:hypothetical protein